MPRAQRPFRAHRAPPKPSTPACPFCADAYWRYNGSSWYPCQRGSSKKHVCESLQAQEERQTRAEARQLQLERARRNDRVSGYAKAGLAVVGAVVVLGLGYSAVTESRDYPGWDGHDLDCVDIGHEVDVTGPDPHGLDGDGDGVGCEGW